MGSSIRQSRVLCGDERSATPLRRRCRAIVCLVLLASGCSALEVPSATPSIVRALGGRDETDATISGTDRSGVVQTIHLVPQMKDKNGGKKEESAQELPPPRKLEDAARTTGPGLTLDQAINATLVADPKIRAGLEAINQASADALTASLLPNPTLLADVQLLPLTRPFTVTQQGGPPQTDYQLSMPIDWFLFGKRAAAMVSAQLGVRQSEADYADLIRQRVRDTAVAFYDVLEARALLDLARQDTQNLTQLEDRIRKALDIGGRT